MKELFKTLQVLSFLCVSRRLDLGGKMIIDRLTKPELELINRWLDEMKMLNINSEIFTEELTNYALCSLNKRCYETDIQTVTMPLISFALQKLNRLADIYDLELFQYDNEEELKQTVANIEYSLAIRNPYKKRK